MTKLSLTWDQLQPDPKPVFYVRRGDRLIARVKHLLFAYRFAKRVDGVVGMIWPDLAPKVQFFDGPNYHPGLIFDLDRFRGSVESKNLKFLQGATSWPKDGRTLRGAEFAPFRNNRFRLDLFSTPSLVFYEDSLLNFRFEGEPTSREWLEGEVRALFASLPLTAEVTDVLARVWNEAHGTDYSCIHFRSGDVYAMVREALPALLDGSLPESRLTLLLGHLVARTSPIEFYDAHVARLIDEGRPILFSSDSPEMLSSFEARYGPGRFVDLSTFQAKEPIQKAMVDFCALGRGRKILGSRGNYGAMAAMLGGAELVVVSASDQSSLAQDEAINIYHACALDLMSPGRPLPRHVDRAVYGEIARRYLYVNRIGDKETLASLDPRPSIRANAAPRS